MSQTENKIYVPRSSAKQVTFPSGKSIIKLGFHVDTMIEFLKNNANEKGYVNLGVSERRQVGERGDTHCVWLDTWKPGQTKPEQPKPLPREDVQAGLREVAKSINTKSDDVPF